MTNRPIGPAPMLALATVLISAAFLALSQPAALAQDGAPAEPESSADSQLERRVIIIDSSGGTQSGNLRYGPIRYQHPDPLGITATVSTLTIRGPSAELSGPPDTLLARAKGRRTARFFGDVIVERGRLAAQGPALVYQESTGLGLLAGGVAVTVAPEEPEGDVTTIHADAAEFDVDTDRSVSRGGVVLTSGTQRAEADQLDYAEELDLASLTCEELCTVVREAEDGSRLVITAEEIRVLTQQERLWARGTVTVVDGDLVTSGDEAVYDDAEQLAEVSGSPARSVDESSGVTLTSDRILQDVEFDYVEAIDASAASRFARHDFLFLEERGADDGASGPP